MKVKEGTAAAVFDLDGTLLNTLPPLAAACNETLKEMGLPPVHEEEVLSYIGMGRRVLVERMMAAQGVTDAASMERALEIYTRASARLSTYKAIPFPGIRDMLDQLRTLGLPLGIVTNKDHRITPEVVHAFFPKNFFLDMRGARPFVPLKPDPKSTLQLLKTLKADPSRSFFIGDSDIDILTGRAAGMHTIGVTWGFRTREELSALKPDLLADRPADITDYIRDAIDRPL